MRVMLQDWNSAHLKPHTWPLWRRWFPRHRKLFTWENLFTYSSTCHVPMISPTSDNSDLHKVGSRGWAEMDFPLISFSLSFLLSFFFPPYPLLLFISFFPLSLFFLISPLLPFLSSDLLFIFPPSFPPSFSFLPFSIILLLLYACEIWPFIIREERRLRVLVNMILRRIFGPKRDENEEWTRPHNEELHSLYRSLHILRVIKSRSLRWADHVARMEEVMSGFKILTGKPTGSKDIWEQDLEANIWAQKWWEWGVESLHNDELVSLYRLPNTVKITKCRRLSEQSM